MSKGNSERTSRLLRLIPSGEENAIPMDYLASLLHISERDLRKAIERCRIDGELICSSDAGYFFPTTLDELKAHYLRMSQRIRTAEASLAPVIDKLLQEGIELG